LRKSRYWLIALPLAAILLYFALRGTDWQRVGEIAAAAKPALLLLGCLVGSISYFIRAVRWRILLCAEAKVGLGAVFWSNSAGYLANNFLPARAGEVLRSAMISARSGLTKTYALTTALSERFLDAFALMIISAAVLLAIPNKPAWLNTAARPFAAAAVGGGLTLVFLPRFQGLIDGIVSRLPFPEKLRHRLLEMAGQVMLGLRSLHHPARLAGFCSLTGLIWFLDAASSVILARAISLPLGFPVALLMLTAIGLGSALPSTPGNVGVFQFATVSVLVPFGFSHTDALAIGLISQAANYAVVALWGLLAMWRYNH
jgi:uncharacterized protein (TIRG00374 family)